MSGRASSLTFGGRLIFALYLALLVLAPFQLAGEARGIQISLQSMILWVIMLVGLVRLALSRGRLRLRRVPFLGLWLLYLLTVLIGFAAGPGNLRDPAQALWSLFRNVELLLLYPLVVQLCDDERRVRALLGAMLVGLSLAALFGVAQTATGGRFFSGLSLSGNQRYLGFLYVERVDPAATAWQIGAPFFRAHGPASSPNLLAALMNIGLVIACGLLLSHYPRWRPLAGVAVAAVLLLLTLGLTLSRAAWVGTGVAAALIAVVQFRLRARLLVRYAVIVLAFAVGVLMLVPLLPASVTSRIASIGNPLATGEVQSRLEVWEIAIERIGERPLVGLGTDRVPGILLRRWGITPPDISPHNIFLAAAYQYGLVHLALLICFLLIMLVSGVRLARRGGTPLARALGLAAVGVVGALMVHGLFDSLLQPQSMVILFWSLQGLVAAIRQAERIGLRRATPVPPSVEIGQPV